MLKRKYIRDYYIDQKHGFYTFTRTAVMSWVRVLFVRGEVDIHRLLGIEFYPVNNPLLFYMIKSVSLVFVIFLRLIVIVGLADIFWRRDYAFFLIGVGLISMFGVTPLRVGRTRYRLPVEPQL